jgi:hypothetical protein
MTDPQQATHLGRTAFQTAGQLRILQELMEAAGWEPDGYAAADLGELASALQGMAIRCAMHAGDSDLLSELTGRPWKDMGPAGGL